MTESLDTKACDCYSRTNAVSVVAYDLSGNPLSDKAVHQLEATLQAFAKREGLILCFARQ
jgi:hypothetical protein